MLASNLFDYEAWWNTEWMDHYRPFGSPWIAAGAGLQVVRGVVFAAVLYPFRSVILGPGGWLKLWALLCGIGILSARPSHSASV